MTTSQKRITKIVDFCAAHSIADAGRCSNKHGHNWRAVIVVDQISGELDSKGFICDVREIKDAAFKYDHDDLDKYFESASTENICQAIADDALLVCTNNNPNATFIVNVHLDETVNNSADTSASNFQVSLPGLALDNSVEQSLEALEAETRYEMGGEMLVSPSGKAKFVKRDEFIKKAT